MWTQGQILGGDGNGYENIMGTDREDDRNTEGESLLDMCNRNDRVIGNSWFQKGEDNVLQLGW
jgi:hypothetical protein